MGMGVIVVKSFSILDISKPYSFDTEKCKIGLDLSKYKNIINKTKNLTSGHSIMFPRFWLNLQVQ